MIRSLLAIIVGAGIALPACAAEGGAGIAGLIENLPTETKIERDRVFGALAGKGEAGVKALADRLTADEIGGDAQARYALHGLALHAGRPGAETERAAFARSVVAQVGSKRPPSVNRFLLRQLVHVGGPETAEALGGFLLDGELGESACLSLVRVGADGRAPLRAALGKIEGRTRLHVIQALGKLRDREAVSLLVPVAAGPSGDVRTVALTALGDIGDPAAADVIAAAAISATGFERTIATAAWITLGRRLTEDGKKDAARKVYRRIMKERAGADAVHAQSAAIRGLVEIDGVAAMPEVAGAQSSDDVELAAAATAVAIGAPGMDVTGWWIERAGIGDPAARAAALKVLGGRNDSSALPAIRKGMKSKDQAVRKAALAAAGKMAATSLVPDLVAALETDDAGERDLARNALLRMPRGPASRAIVKALKAAATPAMRVLFLEVLEERGATDYLDAMTMYLDDANADVRNAALEGAGSLGNRSIVPKVVARVVKAEKKSERRAARDAFAAICRREVKPELCAAPVLAALPGTSVVARSALLRMLASAGGEGALKTVRDGLNHKDAAVKEAAVRALAAWRTDAPVEDLLKIARSDARMKLRVIALRGYVRQVSNIGKWDDAWEEREIVDLLAAGLAAAPRPEDKKIVLSVLGKVGHPAAMKLAEESLGEEACHAEAGTAMVKIAWETYEDREEETLAVMKRLVRATENESIEKKAQEVVDYLNDYGDYITDWRVSGPYDESSVSLDEFIDFKFAPEQADAGKKLWRRLWSRRSWRNPARVRIRISYAGNCVAYLRTYVKSDKARKVRFEVGSDDALKVWLNGDVVHVNTERRGNTYAEDRVKVSLRKGWNEVILKLTQRTGDWETGLRIRSRWGRKIGGLEVDSKHSD